MSAETLSTLTARSIALTPKEDEQGVKVKLKVFWKTTKFWAESDIADFQKNAPGIAERLRTEQYWNKYGEFKNNKFTCEDFAIRMLCEYAAAQGLPVKLTTGVRTYRNMEFYNASEHDRYASNLYGFSEMVMLTYGAPDMQRTGINTVAVATPDELQPGDILAQEQDRSNGRAHHIQLVVLRDTNKIHIYQGNSGIGNTASWISRLLRHNSADPTDSFYTGLPIETGCFTRQGEKWYYENFSSNAYKEDFLKFFGLYRWNFNEFNK
jgi:hypothetical protein